MATSPTYSWPEPDDTSLVKNGALAMRTLGNAIDSTMATMVPKSIVDAKGDLIGATANDTPARLAVGTNGQVLTADSTAATGLAWATPSGGTNSFYAGKNKIMNGDFSIWQRGTTFSNPASLAYTADRFAIFYDGTGATRTISQQTFTPGTAPVAGYEGNFFYRYAVSVAGTSNTVNLLRQFIEDVRTFAGQTVTVSFWAKAAANLNIAKIDFTQNFGTGGSFSGGVDTTAATSVAVTTSWQRFSYSVAVPSISGKTLGTNNNSALELRFFLPSNSTFTFDIWGVQVEAGSTATNFVTASGGSPQAELAMCQRYYYRIAATTITTHYGMGMAFTTTLAVIQAKLAVTMRVSPTSLDYSNIMLFNSTGNFTATLLTLSESNPNFVAMNVDCGGGLTPTVALMLRANATLSSYLGFNAEL